MNGQDAGNGGEVVVLVNEKTQKEFELAQNGTKNGGLVRNGGQMVQYRVYPERWWILVAVFLLNISNYAHWVAFPSVNKTAAKYYDQAGDKMDWIPTLSYGLGVPCGILATYVVERFGFKHAIQIGGSLTGIGEFFRH